MSLSYILGRRKIMLLSMTWFSAAMGLSALSTGPEMLGILRFLAGLGLGGVVPTAIALTVEYSPKNRRQSNNALMYSGYYIGGVLTSLVALVLLPHADFRAMYAFGVLPLILVVPVAWRYLPESVAFLVVRQRHDEARSLARQYGLAIGDVVPSAPPRQEGADSLARIRTIFRPPLPACDVAVRRGQFLWPAACLRAEHLAAQHHAHRRLPTRQLAAVSPGAQHRRHRGHDLGVARGRSGLVSNRSPSVRSWQPA